jgi:hypothetical protein
MLWGLRWCVMPLKIFTMYSLPYIVGTASLVIAAHQVVPSLAPSEPSASEPSAKVTIFSSQVVNRSLKGDRLTIHHAIDQAVDPQHRTLPIPIAPNSKIEIGCEHPLNTPNDVAGRCFADVGRLRLASG